MFNQLLSVGYDAGTAGSIANTANWGQANNRFNNAMSNAPGKPVPTPAPPPMPQASQYRAPTPTNATLGALGTGVRSPNKKRERTTLASLRIRPKRRVNQALTAGSAAGTGLNIG